MKGFININKPEGMTSSDVVVKVRGILRRATGEKQKVGHLGTLDPLGSGVLPIAVGTATRLFDYMQEKVKVYQTTFVFSKTTDTLDRAGKITESVDFVPTVDEIKKELLHMVGQNEQIPPQYSAKSVNGQRAYDLARKGIAVELKPKIITIYAARLIEKVNGRVRICGEDRLLDENEFAFEIACSSGTYIRSIARDLAERLNTVGYMSSIHRIKSGLFEINDAVSLTDFEKEQFRYLKSIEFPLSDYPIFELDEQDAPRVLNGVRLKYDNLPNGDFIVKFNGEIIGIADSIDGALRIKTRL